MCRLPLRKSTGVVENFGFRVTFSSTLDYSVTLTTLCYIYIYADGDINKQKGGRASYWL